MSATWYSQAPEPRPPAPGVRGKLRVAWRASVLLVVLGLGLVVMLALRMVERPFVGQRRLASAYVPQAVSRCALTVLGLRLHTRGTPMRGNGIIVANHSSWLDIFALNAVHRVVFVAKADVAAWPGIGAIARLAGTVFIARDSKEAPRQTAEFTNRIAAGQHMLLFPEGTSTDGAQVLPFKPTLFQALYTAPDTHTLSVQPVSLAYTAPEGADPRCYGWWGEMDFAAHFLAVLAGPRGGQATVISHPPLNVAEQGNRKALAKAAQAACAEGLQHILPPR